ncbi:MAG: hypothetical protein ACYC3X_15990 [Pirellulaceae bacterium]
MLTEFDRQCLELRTRIARSRLRLDRQARAASFDVTRLLPFSATVPGGSWATFAGLLAAGLALTRWRNPPRLLASWRRQLFSTFITGGLDQLTRHLRVLARQSRRRAQPPQQEAPDE